MGLRIQQIDFRQFRNYDYLHLDELGGLTIFIGHNAVGKTNILEGIQLLTSSYSFRHPQLSQLINESFEEARISLLAGDGNRSLDVALSIQSGKKRFTINGKNKASADVRGLVPSILFTPDDLQIAKKSSSVKRAALDNLGMQLTRNYYIVRKDYEKTVRYKNRLFKTDASQALIDSINETLVTCGAQLFCLRSSLFERMMPAVSAAYARLSNNGEPFSALYRPSWNRLAQTDDAEYPTKRDEVREKMAYELEKWGQEERQRGRCLVGPHNDEIMFNLAGKDASVFASQGQQRSIVLSWKLAEVEMVREILGVQPILLLDDVLSELDVARREMLVQFVTDDIQTFITATDLDNFAYSFIGKARVIELPLSSQRGLQ